ncbi:hypothetical protein GTR02_05050 [Kineococcus sp. R8]|uniref:hypothetical protein n=1 Tax=Kineococcus siccus TaxID=2696567 RepID=UPI0014135755|nr:hypothetical protein [Kineococcus siccus]NAZ81179.1 hypothetical protein [Kineococcus siccus]
MRRAVLTATGAALLLAACSTADDDGTRLVTDGTRHRSVPGNAGSITLTVPESPTEPWCLLSNGSLVVWPEGSSYDVAAGEVRDRSGNLRGKLGETVEGGGMVDEPPSSDTLDDVDWAGCTPTDPVLHQYG